MKNESEHHEGFQVDESGEIWMTLNLGQYEPDVERRFLSEDEQQKHFSAQCEFNHSAEAWSRDPVEAERLERRSQAELTRLHRTAMTRFQRAEMRVAREVRRAAASAGAVSRCGCRSRSHRPAAGRRSAMSSSSETRAGPGDSDDPAPPPPHSGSDSGSGVAS